MSAHSHKRLNWITHLAICCLVAGFAVAARAQSPATVAPPDTAWREDFDTLDAQRTWLIQLYSFDASGCNFLPEMLATRNSTLRITVDRNTRSDLPKPYNGGDIGTNAFRSYGLYRVRMKPAAARGSVTAFYLMNRWIPVGWEHKEIDIEFLGRNTRVVQLTTHDFQKGGTLWKSDPTTVTLSFDWSQEFHEYAILWTADEVKWLVDGKLVHRTRKYVPREPLQIRANLYVGNMKEPGVKEWLGAVHDEDLPAHADYDWIAFTPLRDLEQR